MRRIIIICGSLAIAAASLAQQIQQCVNPDVLNALVFNGQGESRVAITRALPDNAAGYRAPNGFTLIGTAVRGEQSRSNVVAYRTTLERDKALDSVVAFLAGEGWARENMPPAQQIPQLIAAPQPAAVTLCRDGDRRRVQVQEIEAVRYATISGAAAVPAASDRRACGVPVPQQPNSFGFVSSSFDAAQAMMPQFSFPDTARVAGAPAGELSLVSGGNSASTVRISTPDRTATLASNLTRQLREQGWRSDAEWAGQLSTGSTWTRRNNAGQTFLGTLEILSLGNGVHDIGFSVTAQ